MAPCSRWMRPSGPSMSIGAVEMSGLCDRRIDEQCDAVRATELDLRLRDMTHEPNLDEGGARSVNGDRLDRGEPLG